MRFSIFYLRAASLLVCLLFLWVSGCADKPRAPERTLVACAPQFTLPATTSIDVQMLDVPEVGDSVLVANIGESMISHGAYSRVASARVMAQEPIEFFYPEVLGIYPVHGKPTVPSWVEDALASKELRALQSEESCIQRPLVDSADNRLAMTALERIKATVLSLSNAGTHARGVNGAPNSFSVMTTAPSFAARGDLITTEHGVLVSGLDQEFLTPKPSNADPAGFTGDVHGLDVSGLFIPSDAALPLMVLLDDGSDRRWLTPASGSIEFKDSLVRPVLRKPSEGTVQQGLIYRGRSGNRVVFTYRRLEGGTAKVPEEKPFVYDLNRGSLVTYRGAQFQIVEATPQQIRYRLHASFTPPPAYTRQ